MKSKHIQRHRVHSTLAAFPYADVATRGLLECHTTRQFHERAWPRNTNLNFDNFNIIIFFFICEQRSKFRSIVHQ